MATATASKTAKGFKVKCPVCASDEGTVRIDLQDLGSCCCSECDWEGSPREALALVQEQARQWAAVVGWVEMAKEALQSAGE